MGIQLAHESKGRLAGLFIVLAAHGVLLYSLWHDRILPPPSEATTLFVDLLKEPPKPEPPKAEPPKPKPQPVKLARPPEPPPRQLVAQAPVLSPTEPVAPLPPPVPPIIDAPPEPAPPPPKPASPVALGGDLAVSCPERTPPDYPSISRRLGEEGKAVLRVELDQRGQIDRATIKTSSGYARLDEAALSAVRHWRCNPAMRDGIAVRAVAIQPFNFVLEGR